MPASATLVLPAGADPARLVVTPEIAAAAGEHGATADTPESDNPLPLLLAGPVLRWASPQRVMVWLATSAELGVTGSIVDASDTTRVLGQGIGTTARWGPRFYVTRVELTPAASSEHARPAFPTGVLLAYDLELRAPEHHELTTAGLIARDEIAYAPYSLPTFVIGEAHGAHCLRIWHGSCRKTHTDGYDAMRRMDADLVSSASTIDGGADHDLVRPRALLLTGDQIYADDVNTDVLRILGHLAELLLGFREVVPQGTDEQDVVARAGERGLLGRIDAGRDAVAIEPGTRASVVRDAGLSADAEVAGNHLLSFGEYVGMYLLVWSPSLWRDWLREAHPTLFGTNVNCMLQALAARRVLANVPTYMMADDHEVTDDYPMSSTQQDAVHDHCVGRWVVASGLAACWLMQLDGNYTGNDPGAPIRSALESYLARGRAGGSRPVAVERDRLAGAASRFGRAVLEQAAGFGYVTPTVPPIILLDTRTQRDLRPEPSPPGLMNATALRWLSEALARHPSPAGAPALIVSPTPVLGHPTAELGQRAATVTADTFYEEDCEAWSLDDDAWYAFLRTVADHCTTAVFLSGDVHYGFMAHASLTRATGPTLSMLQLTSSALNNPPSGMARALWTGTYTSVHEGDLLMGAVLPLATFPPTMVVRENHYARVEIRWAGRLVVKSTSCTATQAISTRWPS